MRVLRSAKWSQAHPCASLRNGSYARAYARVRGNLCTAADVVRRLSTFKLTRAAQPKVPATRKRAYCCSGGIARALRSAICRLSSPRRCAPATPLHRNNYPVPALLVRRTASGRTPKKRVPHTTLADMAASTETVALIAAGGTAVDALVGATAGGLVDFVLDRIRDRREAKVGARLTMLDLSRATSQIINAESEGRWWVFYETRMPAWNARSGVLAAKLSPEAFERVTQSMSELERFADHMTKTPKPPDAEAWHIAATSEELDRMRRNATAAYNALAPLAELKPIEGLLPTRRTGLGGGLQRWLEALREVRRGEAFRRVQARPFQKGWALSAMQGVREGVAEGER
jgi:hypothetical protein